MRRAILQFKALREAVLQLLRGMGGAVCLFIRSHFPDLEISTVNALELLSFLEKNRQELTNLDWTSLMFQPNVPPSLQSYLISFPLEGVVEQGIQGLWNTVLSEFFGKYFGTNTFWRFLGYDSIHNLVGDATILLDALTCFVSYLETSSDDAGAKQHYLASTIKNLRRNPLWDESDFTTLGIKI